MGSYFTDLSSNNGGFNAAQYKSSGARPIAVMLKATEGTSYVNPYYAGPTAQWSRNAHQHGLAVFHYHFCRPDLGTSPTAEADHFAATVKHHFVRPGDYLIGDLEVGHPIEAAEWYREFDARLTHKYRFHPRCYTTKSYIEEGGVTCLSNGFHVAAWGSHNPGGFRWRMLGRDVFAWQFTNGRGYGPGPQSIPGVPGLTDGSYLSPAITRKINRELHQRKGR